MKKRRNGIPAAIYGYEIVCEYKCLGRKKRPRWPQFQETIASLAMTYGVMAGGVDNKVYFSSLDPPFRAHKPGQCAHFCMQHG